MTIDYDYTFHALYFALFLLLTCSPLFYLLIAITVSPVITCCIFVINALTLTVVASGPERLENCWSKESKGACSIANHYILFRGKDRECG